MQFTDARKYKKQVKKLYKSAFPFYERAPLSLLMKRTDNGRDSFHAILEENSFIGLIYTIASEKMVYVFFFAITDENRGKGYGSKVLEEIRKMHGGKPITLMIEDTEEKNAKNMDERIRRLKFYERNGFQRLCIKINEAGVRYELLGTDNSVTQADFLALMKEYIGGFLFKIIYIKTKRKK